MGFARVYAYRQGLFFCLFELRNEWYVGFADLVACFIFIFLSFSLFAGLCTCLILKHTRFRVVDTFYAKKSSWKGKETELGILILFF